MQQTHSEPGPFGGPAYIPNAGLVKRFRNLEFDTLITINSKHLRDKEYPYLKEKGLIRAITLGDSYVFGWGVENDETVSEMLEKELGQKFEVLNMGVSGYCLSDSLKWLEREGVRYEPNIVLVFLYSTPSVCDNPVFFHRGKMYDYDASKAKVWMRVRYFLKRKLYLYSFFEKLSTETYRRLYSEQLRRNSFDPVMTEESLYEMGTLFDRLQKLSNKHHFLTVLVRIPFKEKYDRKPSSADIAYAEKLQNEADVRGWKFFDLSSAFFAAATQQDYRLFFERDDHWNAAGHLQAAHVLSEYIKSEIYSN